MWRVFIWNENQNPFANMKVIFFLLGQCLTGRKIQDDESLRYACVNAPLEIVVLLQNCVFRSCMASKPVVVISTWNNNFKLVFKQTIN